ncbi:MAG: MMPL family transporter [Spirochaetota bacterium]
MISIILLLVFRNLRHALLALVNLAVGIVWMIGAYTLFGDMNLINVLAIPLIVGIGIDYGVHIIHALRHGGSMDEVLATTGRAILLSAMTTMIGFGSLALLGTFRGIATLGTILFLGSATALLSSLVIIPALAGGALSATPQSATEES